MVHKHIFIVVFPELGKKAAAGSRADLGLGELYYWLGFFARSVLVVPYAPWKRAYIEERSPNGLVLASGAAHPYSC